MADVKATLVDSIKDLDASVPGAYQVLVYHSDKDRTAGMAFICPCGCQWHGWLKAGVFVSC